MKSRIVLVLALFLLVTSCAQFEGVPGAEPFPDVNLKKAKSAQHWEVIAGELAGQVIALSNRSDLKGRTFYVTRGDRSAFSRGFQSFLISDLVKSGLPVVTKPDGAVEVRFEAQVVRRPDRYLQGTIFDIPAESANSRSQTNTEVIVTTSLIDRSRYLMRKTDVYYVEDAEGTMFDAPLVSQTKKIEVTGP